MEKDSPFEFLKQHDPNMALNKMRENWSKVQPMW